MNDPERVLKGPDCDLPDSGDASATGSSPRGFNEAAALFQGAPVLEPIRPVRTPASPKIGVHLNRLGNADLIAPDIAALPRSLAEIQTKRFVDLTLAGLALAVLALPMALIAIVLMIEGRTAFFVQPRVGRNRTRFGCLKFRTMRHDAESRLASVLAADLVAAAQWQRHQKLSPDPRTTRLGRWLRATSLDELPQLINVLRGEMSLVGPRPVVAPEVEGYPSDRAYFESPFFNDYAGCLPGITGLWQVSGRHGTAHSERVRLDRIYARNWTVLMDLKILWHTVGVVLSGSGR